MVRKKTDDANAHLHLLLQLQPSLLFLHAAGLARADACACTCLLLETDSSIEHLYNHHRGPQPPTHSLSLVYPHAEFPVSSIAPEMPDAHFYIWLYVHSITNWETWEASARCSPNNRIEAAAIDSLGLLGVGAAGSSIFSQHGMRRQRARGRGERSISRSLLLPISEWSEIRRCPRTCMC
jgi:hypothetical protein